MSAPPARQAAPARRFGRIALIGGGMLLVLLVVGWFAGRAWVETYLRSDAFRAFVNQRVGSTLQAQAEFSPFTFQGLNVYADSLNARGYQDATFAELELQQFRADLSLRRFFQRVWQIDYLEAQRLTIRLDGTRLARESAPPPTSVARTTRGGGFLPNRVEIGSALVRELNLEWGEEPGRTGFLRGMELRANPASGGWDLSGSGGQLVSGTLPALELRGATLRQRGDRLFVNSAEFVESGGGTVKATGEVHFGERLDLQAQIHGIDLAHFLAEDWRLRLRGKVAGEIRVQTPLPVENGVAISGSLRLLSGHLEALPVLDEIALFTRTQQFRRVTLTRASGDFERDTQQLKVTNFVAESEGLLRIEGGFTIVAGQMDGLFQVGVTPGSLQWLPGSQERVFTESRGGYVWTSMRLTGPADALKEDLSGRLAAAAKGAIIDKAETTVRDVIKTGRDAAKSALELLLPSSR